MPEMRDSKREFRRFVRDFLADFPAKSLELPLGSRLVIAGRRAVV